MRILSQSKNHQRQTITYTPEHWNEYRSVYTPEYYISILLVLFMRHHWCSTITSYASGVRSSTLYVTPLMLYQVICTILRATRPWYTVYLSIDTTDALPSFLTLRALDQVHIMHHHRRSTKQSVRLHVLNVWSIYL
jgi:hypothetical protein